MNRIIYGQVIAGSGPDRQGPGIGKDVIRQLFSQLNDSIISGVEHNLAQSPIMRAFNFRIEETLEGELEIKADIEVFKEEAFKTMGGFSISYSVNTYRIGDADQPTVTVLVNPNCFDSNYFISQMKNIIPAGYSIDITEKIEKGMCFDIAIIIILYKTISELTKGFLSTAGADLYNVLKKSIRKDNPSGSVSIQIHIEQPIKMIFEIDANVSSEEFQNTYIPNYTTLLPSYISSTNIDRIVGIVKPGPTIFPIYVVLHDGTTVNFQDNIPLE